MSQVFHNVLLNARQAVPEGGVVDVRAENVVIDEAVQFISPGKYVRILSRAGKSAPAFIPVKWPLANLSVGTESAYANSRHNTHHCACWEYGSLTVGLQNP